MERLQPHLDRLRDWWTTGVAAIFFIGLLALLGWGVAQLAVGTVIWVTGSQADMNDWTWLLAPIWLPPIVGYALPTLQKVFARADRDAMARSGIDRA